MTVITRWNLGRSIGLNVGFFLSTMGLLGFCQVSNSRAETPEDLRGLLAVNAELKTLVGYLESSRPPPQATLRAWAIGAFGHDSLSTRTDESNVKERLALLRYIAATPRLADLLNHPTSDITEVLSNPEDTTETMLPSTVDLLISQIPYRKNPDVSLERLAPKNAIPAQAAPGSSKLPMFLLACSLCVALLAVTFFLGTRASSGAVPASQPMAAQQRVIRGPIEGGKTPDPTIARLRPGAVPQFAAPGSGDGFPASSDPEHAWGSPGGFPPPPALLPPGPPENRESVPAQAFAESTGEAERAPRKLKYPKSLQPRGQRGDAGGSGDPPSFDSMGDPGGGGLFPETPAPPPLDASPASIPGLDLSDLSKMVPRPPTFADSSNDSPRGTKVPPSIEGIPGRASTGDFSPVMGSGARRTTAESTPVSSSEAQRFTAAAAPVSPSEAQRFTAAAAPVSPSEAQRLTAAAAPVSPSGAQRFTIESAPLDSQELASLSPRVGSVGPVTGGGSIDNTSITEGPWVPPVKPAAPLPSTPTPRERPPAPPAVSGGAREKSSTFDALKDLVPGPPDEIADGPVGIFPSRYQVLSTLGRGGMGIVYKAKDMKTGDLVAIKTLLKSSVDSHMARERFFREFKAMMTLDHAGIIKTSDIGEKENPYFVMEFVDGVDIGTKLLDATLPVATTVSVGIQLAEALGYAHSRGVIHRDLKPGNILLMKDNKVKVVDFGLARLDSSAAITQAGTILGSLRFMAPEQLIGDSIDHRADIYGIGATLYYMLSGTTPHEGQPPPAKLTRPADSILRHEPDLPKKLAEAIMTSLEKNVADRYQTCGELRSALLKVQNSLH